MKHILIIPILITGTVISLNAMDRESWINQKAREIEERTKALDRPFYQEKSDELHKNQLIFRGGLTAFWGYIFHKENKKFGSAVIKATLFVLSLWWFINEFKNPSKAAGRTSLLYHRETRGVNWARALAEEEWEKRQKS